MNLRGRVKKLERVSGETVRQAEGHDDPILWTRRFRAAEQANEQIYQDICAHGRAHPKDYFYEGRTLEVHVAECFKAIYFPIVHAIDSDSEPTYGGFAETPELLRRLVTRLNAFLRTDRRPFPLYYDAIESLAGPRGEQVRDLWCLYADLAELWVADRNHPTLLAWRQRLAHQALAG